MESHPQVTVDQYNLSDFAAFDYSALTEKLNSDKIPVSKDENIAESVCVIGEVKNWQRYLYVPGAWDSVKGDIVVDPGEAASRMHRVYPGAKVLLLIREQSG